MAQNTIPISDLAGIVNEPQKLPGRSTFKSDCGAKIEIMN